MRRFTKPEIEATRSRRLLSGALLAASVTLGLTLFGPTSASAEEVPADGDLIPLVEVDTSVPSEVDAPEDLPTAGPEVDAPPPVGPAPPDPDRLDPVLPEPAPVIQVRSGQTSIELSWTTPERADGLVVWGEVGNYDRVEVTDEGTDHVVTLSDLECDATWAADVVVSTADGSAHRTRDLVLRTLPCSIDPDSVAFESVIAFDDHAFVTWGTADPSQGIVIYGEDLSYGNAVNEPQYNTFHSVELTGLECGTEYNYRIIDGYADGATDHSDNVTFSTYSCDPTVDGVSIAAGGDWAEISITTDTATTVGVIYGPDREYGSEVRSGIADVVHSLRLSDLECGTDYLYRLVTVADDSGDIEWRPQATFATAACSPPETPAAPENPDVEAPTDEVSEPPALPELEGAGITEVRLTHAEQNAIYIEWDTDVAAAGSVIYGPTPGYGSELVSGVVADHQALVVGDLECGTDYHLAVIASAPTGELSWSQSYVFATLECDSAVISDIAIDAGTNAAAISWTTDVAAHGLVVYGFDPSYGNAALTPTDQPEQSVNLNDLACGATYEARIAAETASGSSSWTRNFTFQTAPCEESIPEPPADTVV